MHSTVHYCTELNCTAQYRTVLCCNVVHCSVLYCNILLSWHITWCICNILFDLVCLFSVKIVGGILVQYVYTVRNSLWTCFGGLPSPSCSCTELRCTALLGLIYYRWYFHKALQGKITPDKKCIRAILRKIFSDSRMQDFFSPLTTFIYFQRFYIYIANYPPLSI